MVKTNVIIQLALCLFVISCEYGDHAGERVFFYEASTSLKRIDENIIDPKDPTTHSQELYNLNTSSRLLIKSDELSDKFEDQKVTKDFVMALNIYTDRTDLSEAEINSIKLCPLNQNWMIFATWEKYFTSKKSYWRKAGGDFNSSECIAVAKYNSPDDITDPPSSSSSKLDKTQDDENNILTGSSAKIQFDITNWFLNSVYSGQENKGFVLISDLEILIFGDSSSLAPVIVWSDLSKKKVWRIGN